MSSDEAMRKEESGSTALNDTFDIRPIVYSFKGPHQSHVSGYVVTAAQPPQWLCHDHVLGVIWIIFHKDKNYVGISQLQWCLKFLLDLKNSQGEYTGDVEICIQVIQDDLIEQYAKLGPALEKSIGEKSSREVKARAVAAGDKNNELLENSESKEPISAHLTDGTKSSNEENDEKGKGVEKFIMASSQGITGTSTPKEKAPQASNQENDNNNKHSEQHCLFTCKTNDAKKKKEDALSFTYNEMVSRGPRPCAEPCTIEDPCKDQTTEHSRRQQTGVNLPDMNSSELVNFLNSSRQQHVERINKEMDTLHVLERIMKKINADGFPANHAQDLAKRLENLKSEVVTLKTD